MSGCRRVSTKQRRFLEFAASTAAVCSLLCSGAEGSEPDRYRVVRVPWEQRQQGLRHLTRNNHTVGLLVGIPHAGQLERVATTFARRRRPGQSLLTDDREVPARPVDGWHRYDDIVELHQFIGASLRQTIEPLLNTLFSDARDALVGALRGRMRRQQPNQHQVEARVAELSENLRPASLSFMTANGHESWPGNGRPPGPEVHFELEVLSLIAHLAGRDGGTRWWTGEEAEGRPGHILPGEILVLVGSNVRNFPELTLGCASSRRRGDRLGLAPLLHQAPGPVADRSPKTDGRRVPPLRATVILRGPVSGDWIVHPEGSQTKIPDYDADAQRAALARGVEAASRLDALSSTR
jgi:hypothetical protein